MVQNYSAIIVKWMNILNFECLNKDHQLKLHKLEGILRFAIACYASCIGLPAKYQNIEHI
ncbi:hypothetical protein SAMN05421749_103107 [Acinetobacter marinus]|uniref:Uncharacterized protein n=1 Tax=Acinetobacter marinus TaxID=281375 RepID=A0A1G6IPH5_9GAMM|nr:hypothetical protein SAMN05421749_103107 [Acinetobacter marinus]